jgi:AcrR family transcriptional regulator
LKQSLEKLVADLIATGKFESAGDPATPRARIARAALELFAEHSYEGTTTKAIARRARTTERTLFKHFGSKDRLFAETVFPAFLKALAPVVTDPKMQQPDLARTDDFRATLRTLLVNRITAATQHPSLIIMIWRELLIRPAFRSAYGMLFAQQVKPIFDAFVARGRDSGQLRDVPTEVVFRTILGQLIGYLVARLVIAPERAWDTEPDADQILETILQGVGKAG